MSANKTIVATVPALTITVSKKILNPLMISLHKAVKDSFPVCTKEVEEVIRRLENNDNWISDDAPDLEHIRIVETDGIVNISFSAELAEAYINITIKSIPLLVSVYTALINLKSLFKLSGLKEAVKNYDSMLTMTRITRDEAAKKTRKPRTANAATKAAE